MTSLRVYPEFIMKEDLSPDDGFGDDIDDRCQQIYDATKGWGANAKKVIKSLVSGMDSTHRVYIYMRYKELFDNKDVGELMHKEFSGQLGMALQFLALPLHMSECCMLKRAMEGIGCNIHVIYSIMCGRTNEEMNMIKKTYYKMYSKDLGQQLAGELHGNMEVLIINCLQAGEETYDPQYHTSGKASEDAEAIHAMGQGRRRTNERGIFKVVCSSPPEYLKKIDQAYTDKYGYNLLKALQKELSGNVSKGTLYLVGIKLKPYETIARLIKSACAGMGTDELLLTCCIVRYQEVILKDVMACHLELFEKTIHERVRAELSGNYKTCLLEALNTVWPE